MAKDLETRSVEIQVRANENEIEPAWQTRLGSTWQLRTTDSMRAVLADGYLDSVVGHGFRVNDRIEVVCLATAPTTHATLAVDEIRYAEPGEPRVITRPIFIAKEK